MSTVLKSMLQHIINDRIDEAGTDLHAYLTDKMRAQLGLNEETGDTYSKIEKWLKSNLRGGTIRDKGPSDHSDGTDTAFNEYVVKLSSGSADKFEAALKSMNVEHSVKDKDGKYEVWFYLPDSDVN